MKKIFYLKTCDTCKRILKSIEKLDQFKLVDIKENPLKIKDLEELTALGCTYESLFSRKAKLYKEMGLKDAQLTENDYKRYLLEHYTFLSRPVIIYNDKVFIGSSPKNLALLLDYLKNE